MSDRGPETPAPPGPASGAVLARVHMFWHGAELSRVERLAMSSFLAHGHAVTLHIYAEPRGVPPGVTLADARQVLPEARLFRHRKSGSYAIFADWFRYSVLHQLGGIWADTDVVCLRPLQYPVTEIFAWEDERYINNAILGFSAGHELAAWMAECCASPNRILPYDNLKIKWRKLWRRMRPGTGLDLVRWGEFGPHGLTAAIRHFGYLDRALPAWSFYPVHYRDWRLVFESDRPELRAATAQSTAIHLWHNMMRREPGFEKNGRFPESSLFEELCRRYLKNDS